MAHRGPGIRPLFEHTRQTLIRNLLAIIRTPTPIAAVNAAEGWSRDGTVDIADELRRRFAEHDDVPVSVEEFLELAKR